MSNVGRVLGAFTILAVGIGCGSSSRDTGPTGKVCEKAMKNPIPFQMDEKSQAILISLDPEKGELAKYPGKYTYQGGNLYYKNNKTGLQIYLGDATSQRTPGKFNMTTNCISGLLPDTAGIAEDFSVVSDMIVQPEGNKVTDIKVRNYFLAYANHALIRKADYDDKAKYEAPNKVFEGKLTDVAFYKLDPKSDTAFQLRAQIVKGPVTINLLVRYVRDADLKKLPSNYDSRPQGAR